MNWRDAVLKVLNEADEPMHYTDIAQAVIDQSLRSSVGATPAATVAAVLTDPRVRSRVVKIERGVYQLTTRQSASSPDAAPSAAPRVQDKSVGSSDVALDDEDMGLINAFGMFWRRSGVDWSQRSPRLLGSQQSGSKEVDFAQQAGVYLLHDSARTVYVGRVTQIRMGVRLWEHTRDRLSGRWDRFSWFGVRPVGDDGGLGSVPTSAFSPEMLIATMEALLIEGLEPPQNRRQGDRFNALEFLQVEDPALQRQRLLSDVMNAITPG